jgi:arylsulfatase A-like enzyme
MKVINKIPLLAGALALNASSAFAKADKPNIIVIITDQQSYNAISAFRDIYPGDYFHTPNIDRIAKEGIAFTNTYCANPVSVPSRFALFTGKFGGQYGVRENRCTDAVESEVRPMLAMNGMGGVFARGGYDTYYGGKVHLPFSGEKGKNAFCAPVAYGFDNYFTKDEREELGKETASLIDRIAKEKPAKPALIIASFLNPHDICLESSTGLSPNVEDKGGRKQLITDCVRAMRARAAAIDSVEFYAKHAPQLPFNQAETRDFPKFKKAPLKDFPDYYWRKYRWTYGQLVELVDSHIGTILDALDRNPELKKNTIVVFTSDHGEMQGAHHMVTKNIPYDECQRVPLVFAGRGIAHGRNASAVCNGVDLLPTLCELAGIQAPSCDGVSIAKKVTGKDKVVDTKRIIYTEGDGFISVADANYKYTLFDGAKGAEMLIDLKNDRGELVNVISEHPDVAARLKAAIPATLYKIQSRYSGERDTKNGKAGKKNGNKLGNKKNKKTKNA